MKNMKKITDLKFKLENQKQVDNNLKSKSYSFFKFINVATILATGILFFNTGKRNNNTINEGLNASYDNTEIFFFEEDNVAKAIPGW